MKPCRDCLDFGYNWKVGTGWVPCSCPAKRDRRKRV